MEKKFLAIIAYDGSKFYGMQIQPNKKTIQGEIEKALKTLKINTKIQHAGRTDRGVHALNQTISFNAPSFWEKEKLKKALNKILHPYIHIKTIKETSKEFNPRFDAKKRSYRYLISNVFSCHMADYITFYPQNLNIELIKDSLRLFEGTHDFEYFSKTGSEVKNYIRKIYKTNFYKHKNLYVFKIVGNSFLRGQIRIIVDFILKINEGKLTKEDLKKQLNKEKLISKHLAPPNGLYLERIWY